MATCGGDKEDGPAAAARKEAGVVLDRTETLTNDLLAKRTAGIMAIAADTTLRGSAAPCSADLSKLEAKGDKLAYEVEFLKPSELATASTLSQERIHKFLLRQGQKVRSKSSGTAPEQLLESAKRFAEASYWDFDITIVEDNRAGPGLGEAGKSEPAGPGRVGSFEAGVLQGRMYLWSYAESKVVCVAPVTAKNSESVKVQVDGKTGEVFTGKLESDLNLQAVRAGLKALVDVGDGSVVLGEADATYGSDRIAEVVALADTSCACKDMACASKVRIEMTNWITNAQKTPSTAGQVREMEAALGRADVCAAQHSPTIIAAMKLKAEVCACAAKKDKACATALMGKMPDPEVELKGSANENMLLYGAGYAAAECMWKAGGSLVDVKWTKWVVNKSKYMSR
jgi:hypothetical protein